MTAGNRTVVLPPWLPSPANLAYFAKIATAISIAFGFLTFAAVVVQQVRDLTTAVARLQVLPQQVVVVETKIAELQARMIEQEAETRARDERHAELTAFEGKVLATIESHSKLMDEFAADIVAMDAKIDNLYLAITGRKYYNGRTMVR